MPASKPASAASLELAPINSPSGGAPPSASAERARHDAAAAQNVFQAKDGAPAERSRKGLVLSIALAVIILAVAGAGFYVWQKVDSFTPRVAASARPRPTPIRAPPTVTQPTPQPQTILNPPPQQPRAPVQPPAPSGVEK